MASKPMSPHPKKPKRRPRQREIAKKAVDGLSGFLQSRSKLESPFSTANQTWKETFWAGTRKLKSYPFAESLHQVSVPRAKIREHAMSEILINTTTAGVQHQPGACNFGVELYFVVWRDDNGDIKGRFFDDRGKPSKSEFGVNVPTNAANTDGNFPVVEGTLTGPVVVWIESAFNPPGPRPHVKLRRYDGEGQPIGSEIQVSTNNVDPKHRPGITGMIDGGFLVCWADARANQ